MVNYEKSDCHSPVGGGGGRQLLQMISAYCIFQHIDRNYISENTDKQHT